MRVPEKKVKEEIRTLLKQRGAWFFMPQMTGYGRAGIPDFICCYKGQFFAIEAKATAGICTPPQTRELQAIQAHGGLACVAKGAEGVDKVEAILDAIDHLQPEA